MRGRFITLEGGEGAGKSTQARLLAARLREAGRAVVVTREPGGSSLAERIRDFLLGGGAKPLGPVAEAMLFHAARHDHLETLIRPALGRGDWVVSDRFADSTRAYQGAAGLADAALLARIEAAIVGDTRPDLTLVLDLPPEIGLARAGARSNTPDRFEGEALAFHRTLRDAFRAIAAAEPERCVVIDATHDREIVAAAIWQAVAARLKPGAAHV